MSDATSHRVRVEMVIGWRRWWLPWRPKQIRMANVTTREDALEMAHQVFTSSPKVVAVVLIGPTWLQRITRDGWTSTVDSHA